MKRDDDLPPVAQPEPRKVLSESHPVVTWLKNRRTHLEASLMLSDEEKTAAMASVDEALGILTNAQ